MDHQPQSQGLTRLSPDLNAGPKLNSYLQPQQVPSQSQSQRQPSSSPYQTSQKGRRPLSYQPQPTYLEAGRRSNNASPQRRQSPLPGRFNEEWDASRRGSSIIDGPRGQSPPVMSASAAAGPSAMQRSNSVNSYAAGDDRALPQRGNTLKKKASLRRSGTGSIVRSSSRRSARAGSVRSLALQTATDPDELHSAFFCPVPTNGNPTDVLAARFQTWRKMLKDLIAYYREVQSHYEQKSKSLAKLSSVANNISNPTSFLQTAGIDDALQIIRNYNKQALQEATKAKEIEEDVILALTGLRSDLQQKIKEIKHLAGDFKNSVEKEMDGTGKAVKVLSEALGKNEMDTSATTGKQDPYLLRLAVDRQIERQIDEENYLHQAYLNLEGSGRELESIIVGEIQKAYNAYAGILKREADNAHSVVGELRDGPIAMPKDQEWEHFVANDNRVVNPSMPLRSAEQIHYPGQDHLSAQEIRAGLLERKSKYLKSYTAGWYVLSTTHLHEFKSADKAQAPIMSLYLPEQKLGSRSSEGGPSNKFLLKGRQTGAMHRGHTWVFRAESHDTMMAWYEDIRALTETSPEERTAFVRSHSRRSTSRSSHRSASSDGLDEEEDEEPFTATEQDVTPGPRADIAARRPQPGGRFPSDIQVNAQRGLQVPQSPSSVGSSQEPQAGVIAAATAIPGSGTDAYAPDKLTHHNEGHPEYGQRGETPISNVHAQAVAADHEAQVDGVNPYTSEPVDQSQSHHRNVFVTPLIIPGTRQPVNGIGGNRALSPEQQHNAAAINGVAGGAETNDINGGHYKNVGGAGALSPDAIPRSEVQPDESGLQVLPGQGDSAQPVGGLNPVRGINDERAASSVTVSDLPMPGSFP
ncbi:Phosphatidylinositol 4,5-bisphosphate-binding protein SLM1 [Trichoderma lentiforme]|uniref:Phosphatidylinositol 4,5-bisphosphate-binding protein SLM1 n=1 Tax=Trichoderma lentiforme TaxID=1567552 RepID=A0A9P4X681_9HYPO|nr:Phosphatidylinositol 4,5-bisphosphate-binding protein SLM1 [Trichoderma lentiforme]